MHMKWLTEHSRSFLTKGYLKGGESAEARIKAIADHAQFLLGIEGFADKFYGYMEEGYYSLASPIWSNFGLSRGLPISCFGSYTGDDMGQILFTQAEVGMMSKYGGGTSGYFGALRGRGASITDNGTSSGSVHFMQLFESVMNVVSQGSTRRGHFAPYLPIDHPDIDEFLEIGTEGNPIQELTHAVTVPDAWMEEMIGGDEKKRSTWAKVLARRGQMGYPYIFFSDTVNRNTVDVYKDKGLQIYASNLCTEVLLPSHEEWSFVCDLSSMNALYFEQWKDTDAVETLVYFLDAVMTDFITKLASLRDSDDPHKRQNFKFMERAYNFAVANRALGVGVLGWHSYLQSRMIPFYSTEAGKLNVAIFKHIQEAAYKASKELAVLCGEPSLLAGYGRRNTTLTAVAPTTSSAFILGQVSQSIEPIWSNCYVKDIDKMKVTIKNRTLEALLEKKGCNTKEVWRSIRDADGSVAHLHMLTAEEKEVFKTFSEIAQEAVIEQAAMRQAYIDQGQSLNIMVNPATPIKDINRFYIDAWKMGVKTLYYQHSMNAAQQLGRQKLAENTCVTCEA
jgi:ribonucleoside-diphosphate reductase alpha chain